MSEPRDYAHDGIDIQTAMVRHVKAHPDRRTRTHYIMWGGSKLWTNYHIPVPKNGRFRLQFLSPPRQSPQGFDVRAEDGGIRLEGGESVNVLRTWHEERYEDTVEYPFMSRAGLLIVWNVYHWSWPDGSVTEEKWRGNAGFRVEGDVNHGLVFHCSPGPVDVPDFEQLVVQMTVLGANGDGEKE